MKTIQKNHKSHGFISISAIALIALVIGVVGFGGWTVVQKQNNKQLDQQTQTSDSSKAGKLSADVNDQSELKAEDTPVPTDKNNPTVASTATKPTKPVNNSTPGAVKKVMPAPTKYTIPESKLSTDSSPTSSVTRPTAEFCAQKNGNSFTNVALTGTGTYTYQGYAWENGYSLSLPMTSKTETGTPLRNYDSMQIFDVLPYGSKPMWAQCSDKAGYIMYYYSVPSSPYTFNVLVEFGHVSLT